MESGLAEDHLLYELLFSDETYWWIGYKVNESSSSDLTPRPLVYGTAGAENFLPL